MKNIIFALLFGFGSLFAVDMDNDLVQDDIDICLDTPAGVFVDMQGCTKEIKRIVNFDHNLYMLDITNMQQLQEYAQLAREAFGYKIVLKGHTDSTADYKTNINLSKKRVYTVLKHLEAMGINSERISVKWYGETMPIATNVTSKGRSLNRRVEIILK
jgi:OOP family OmpA-OmpF porin